jgi:hypothetical protein
MHPTSYNGIKSLVDTYIDKEKHCDIIEVGSYDVNGTYKTIFQGNPNWTYFGIDIIAGRNVDKVVLPYNYDIPDESYDLVLSGQCLEHVEMPWIWITEVFRICKTGGLLMLTAPWSWVQHSHPVDCWRILPDGMQVLLEKVVKTTILHLSSNNTDTFAVARK